MRSCQASPFWKFGWRLNPLPPPTPCRKWEGGFTLWTLTSFTWFMTTVPINVIQILLNLPHRFFSNRFWRSSDHSTDESTKFNVNDERKIYQKNKPLKWSGGYIKKVLFLGLKWSETLSVALTIKHNFTAKAR